MDDDNYTNAHRAFLQTCARHSILNFKQALLTFGVVQRQCKFVVEIFSQKKKNILINLYALILNVSSKDGDPNAAVDDKALRTMVEQINAKFAEHEIDQRLSFVSLQWDEPIGEFLVLCNTLASVG